MQLIKTLFPKLRIVARGNVMKVIGDEDESELFLKKIREVEKYCEEFNSLSEDYLNISCRCHPSWRQSQTAWISISSSVTV